MAKKVVGVIDITPTWSGLLPALIELANGNNHEARKEARENLHKIAAIADKYVELSKGTSPSTLARDMVGDGRSPNLYFVSVGYGWYLPYKDGDMDVDAKQVKGALSEGSTLGPFTSYEQAKEVFDAIPTPYSLDIKDLKGTTISQVMIEDRKEGVVREKFYYEYAKEKIRLINS